MFYLILYIYLSIIYGPFINYIGKIKTNYINKDNKYLLLYNLSNISNIQEYFKYILCILLLITICLIYYDHIQTKSQSFIIYIFVFIHIYLIYLFLNIKNIPTYIYKILEYSGIIISIFYLFQLIILLY